MDENEMSSILGKCHVSRKNPGLLLSQQINVSKEELIATSNSTSNKRSREGSFTCNFDISITTAGKGKGKVTIIPYNGPDISEDVPPSKRSRTSSFAESVETGNVDTSNESMSLDDAPSVNADNSNEDVDDESSLEEAEKELITNSNFPTTEGSATQKIMVGEKHQAVIPLIVMNAVANDRDAPPVMVWKPNCIPDKELQIFIEEVGQLLKAYMKERNIGFTSDIPPNVDPNHLPSNCTCREFNLDRILKLLHEKSYSTDVALKAIKASPQTFIFIWTKEEKEMYDAGFKRHFSAIRLISRGMSSLKTHMEVVDYHYRFKIPEQFRRYQDKKREQARRMLDCIEKQRMDEYVSSETSQAASNATNGSKKMLNWYVCHLICFPES